MARWQYLGGAGREFPLYSLDVVPGDVVDCTVCPDAVLFADAGTAPVTATLTLPSTVTAADGSVLNVRGGRLPSTSYAVNDAVSHDGQVWRCIAPYTSSSSDYFNPGQLRHWVRATITNIPPGSGTFALATDAAANAAAITAQTTLRASNGVGVALKSGGTWPTRPSGYAQVRWFGASPGPTIGGTGNAVDGIDEWVDLT